MATLIRTHDDKGAGGLLIGIKDISSCQAVRQLTPIVLSLVWGGTTRESPR